MADKVQKKLEDFVSDLQLLFSQKLLSLTEIKKIIKKRRKFEFDILNIDPNLSLISYKNYINYEIKLNRLIKSRFNNKYKNGLRNRELEEEYGDYDGVKGSHENNRLKLKRYINNNKYVFNLFNKCINRFVNNIEVYNLYLRYCKKLKSNKLFEKVIVKSLSKNPNNEKLWLILSSFLLKNKGLVFSKNIIQKSLRILPDNLNLILYLFQLEVKSFLIIVNSEKGKDKTSRERELVNQRELETNSGELENILNRLYIIFEYGYNKLKEDKLTIFYFSVLNTLNQLIKFNLSELDKLFDQINDLISKKSIPIIVLYNYQVKLLEVLLLILYNNSKDINDSDLSAELNFELETIIYKMDNRDLLVLFLQFLYNIFNWNSESSSSDNLNVEDVEIIDFKNAENTNNFDNLNNTSFKNVEINSFNNLKNNNKNDNLQNNKFDDSELNNKENQYLVTQYCHLENIYYICLLGSPPNDYVVNRCSYTGNLVNVEQLKYMRNLFSKYFSIVLFNENTRELGIDESESGNEKIYSISNKIDLWPFLLNLKLEGVNGIYYYLKLLYLLSKRNLNGELEYVVQGRIEDLVKQLGSLSNINNDELLHLLLKLNVNYGFKKRVLLNFTGIDNPGHLTTSLLSSDLSASEIVEVFVMFSKWGDDEFLKNFVNSFSEKYDVNLLYHFVLTDPGVRNSHFNLCNKILTHLISIIDHHLDNLEPNTQPLNDFLETLNSIPKRFQLTDVNRNLIDSVNLKLNLLNFNTIELTSI